MNSTSYSRYDAYMQNSVVGRSPVQLITALYEGAIEASQQAVRCLESGDIWARGKAVNKATSIVTELLISLDMEKGGAIALNLKRLYGYMQSKLIEGHAKKSRAAFEEVEKLLGTLLEAWRVVEWKSTAGAEAAYEDVQPVSATVAEEIETALPYGAYFCEPPATLSRVAYTC